MQAMKMVDTASAVGSNDTGDFPQIRAFEEAPVLGAKNAPTITKVHAGGKRKKSTNRRGKKTRVKRRVHKKKGYKKTLKNKNKNKNKRKSARRNRK